MRIGINARLLLRDRLEGIGWHAWEIIRRMIRNHPEHQFILFYDRREGILIPEGENIETAVKFPPSRHPLLIWWWCRALGHACRHHRIEVFYSPEVLMPSGISVPCLITLHDLSPLILPHSLPLAHRWYYRYAIKKNAGEAVHLFTVSQFTRSEILRILQVHPGKISVVYNAARPSFKPITDSAGLRNRFSDGHPYFIYVGALHQRKNVDQIIAAFDAFKKQEGSPHKLILAGKFMGKHRRVRKAIARSGNRADLLILGYVAEPNLGPLIAGAEALINLSEYEGFGMPLVEAFQAGTPVIAADRSCYPEICGQAGLLVNPHDTADVVQAMQKAILQRRALVEAGFLQAGKYNWEESAEQVWERIRITAQNSSHLSR
ncbi:MAG TPA: glycosyltransferase family 1 protein [Saprospiraceae bacterium]|nr:glycosyltransferase family 1 protein [Saprospiraceae bacterium]